MLIYFRSENNRENNLKANYGCKNHIEVDFNVTDINAPDIGYENDSDDVDVDYENDSNDVDVDYENDLNDVNHDILEGIIIK